MTFFLLRKNVILYHQVTGSYLMILLEASLNFPVTGSYWKIGIRKVEQSANNASTKQWN